jgi:hypothetical protein
MGNLIKIQDIDKLSEVKAIPDAAISAAILSNIRNLDEKTELERFLREILYDPNSSWSYGNSGYIDKSCEC